MTVRQLLESIDSRELTEWQLYERENGPFGGERLDILAAKVLAMIMRVNVEPKDQAKIKEADFLVKWNGGGIGPDGDD
jgi:hypothetical protein